MVVSACVIPTDHLRTPCVRLSEGRALRERGHHFHIVVYKPHHLTRLWANLPVVDRIQ
ncbi:hypothetical protein BD413DRAFT_594098 [Trametes elegans]|nr:hypothetical protein BD413DRAFT_594098 [Trametes elegans]